MNALMWLAIAFAAIITVGSVAVAINDAVERWLARSPGPGDGGLQPAAGCKVHAHRPVVAAAQRSAASVRVREGRPLWEAGRRHAGPNRRPGGVR